MFDFTARPLAEKKGVYSRYRKRTFHRLSCAQTFRGLGADAVAATGKLNADAQRRLRLAADPAALHLDEGIVGRGKARTDQSRRV